jgi:cytoplasmic iron level regulating protein YaaA (DUF328/UPF0246 family)
MKIVISPSKTMLEKSWHNCTDASIFKSDKTNQLISILQGKSKQDFSKMFKVKNQLLDTVFDYYHQRDSFPYVPAFYSMNGLVYKQLSRNYNNTQYKYINNHIRILDALHGVLVPCHLIKSYRFDFLIRIGINLYEFWKDDIVFEDEIIINLASNEFSKLIEDHHNRIDIEFYQEKDGKLRAQSTHVKMARGKLLEYMILNKIESIDSIKNFSDAGYQYTKSLSSNSKIVFIKKED